MKPKVAIFTELKLITERGKFGTKVKLACGAGRLWGQRTDRQLNTRLASPRLSRGLLSVILVSSHRDWSGSTGGLVGFMAGRSVSCCLMAWLAAPSFPTATRM